MYKSQKTVNGNVGFGITLERANQQAINMEMNGCIDCSNCINWSNRNGCKGCFNCTNCTICFN